MSTMTPVTAAGFDYSALPASQAHDARAAAGRINARLRESYIETGSDLIAIKNKLGHGQFCKWVAAEFEITERTAGRYMRAAQLAAKSDTVSVLPATAVDALAAPSAPAAVVDEVLAAVEAGSRPNTRDIKAKLVAAAVVERMTKVQAKKTPEQKRKEAEAQKRQDARAKASSLKLQQQTARETKERDRARSAAEWLVRRLGSRATAEFLVLAHDTDWRRIQQQFQTSPGFPMNGPQIIETFAVAADGSPDGVAA